MAKQNFEKAVYTEIEAAEYVSMSRSFLRQARLEGGGANKTKGPEFIKIGRSIRYPKESLDSWLGSFSKMTTITGE